MNSLFNLETFSKSIVGIVQFSRVSDLPSGAGALEGLA